MSKRFSFALLIVAILGMVGCGPAKSGLPLYVSPSSTSVPLPGPKPSYFTIFSPPPVPVPSVTNPTTLVSPSSPGGFAPVTNGTGEPVTFVYPTMTYEKALSLYGHRFRLQFLNCSASPGTFNIKRGVSFMLDNRDPVAHIIAVGLRQFDIQGYSFAIIKATTVGTNYVTCDGGGSAQIIVSK